MSEIRVVLVDDQHLVRAGLRALLERAPDITVVGEAGDGATGLAVVRTHRPDVVLMDVRMPGTDGLQATRQILADPTCPTKVIILTTFDLDHYVYEALNAGASGFLLKDVTPEQLVAAVRLVTAGDALLAPTITRRLVERFARPAAATEPYSVGRGAGSGGVLVRGPAPAQDFLPRVAPPRPRRLTPDSVRIRWMKP